MKRMTDNFNQDIKKTQNQETRSTLMIQKNNYDGQIKDF